MSTQEKGARNAAVSFALNRKVQGGGNCHTSGFPSSGHAHGKASRLLIRDYRLKGIDQLANTPGMV